MTLTIMTCAALILGAIQRANSRRWAAVFFMAPVMFHGIAGPLMGDVTYYVSAGLVGLMVTGVLMAGGLCDELALAAWTSIFINMFGLVSWYLWQGPELYDRAFILFWGWVLWILFRGSKAYGLAGVIRMLYRGARVFRYAFPRVRVDSIWKT